ncbi:hypothetical protein ACFFWC_13775 [Plantactinospora siamensis]|uniref:DUF2867 domain-containing protein n=1 Tax=Plantactinospora siamensis TaxID=555372 RepID=A0ABV6P2G9_9ACTN
MPNDAGGGAHPGGEPIRIGELPFLDEHGTDIAAGPETVWPILVEAVDRAFSGARAAAYARLIGCADPLASGPRPLAEGSTVPGFRVVAAVPGVELALAGRHRFSTYALSFHLDRDGAGGVRLRAESRAAFPGPAGRAYRLLVFGSRAHVILLRGLLARIRRRAQR